MEVRKDNFHDLFTEKNLKSQYTGTTTTTNKTKNKLNKQTKELQGSQEGLTSCYC